jgi:hypothetical protein
MPYLSRHKDDKKSVFAVCPGCDNPIQLIGLFKRVENPKNPYGKHVPHDINELAKYDQAKYIYCPYSNPNRKYSKDRRRGEDKLAKDLITLLHSQFDRVVRLLQKDIDVRLSPNLLKKMLSDYFAMEFYLYYGATLNNLPWMFGYASSHKSLFGQYIRKGSGLYAAILEHCQDAVFIDEGKTFVKLMNKPGEFIDIDFAFRFHEVRKEGEDIRETLDFYAVHGPIEDVTKYPEHIFYEATINIDIAKFLNSISEPSEETERDEFLLGIADDFYKHKVKI